MFRKHASILSCSFLACLCLPFLFGYHPPILIFSFCLDAKKTKKSRQNPTPPGVFAIPRLPACNSALFYFLSCCVMVYQNLLLSHPLLLAPFPQSLNYRFKSACAACFQSQGLLASNCILPTSKPLLSHPISRGSILPHSWYSQIQISVSCAGPSFQHHLSKVYNS